MIEPTALLGREVFGVIASWFVSSSKSVRKLLHVWLHVDEIGPVQIHAHNGVELDCTQPPVPYDMPELGAAVEVINGTPLSLQRIVGATISGINLLFEADHDFEVGLLIRTSAEDVGVVDLGDDLEIGDWNDGDRWHRVGVRLPD